MGLGTGLGQSLFCDQEFSIGFCTRDLPVGNLGGVTEQHTHWRISDEGEERDALTALSSDPHDRLRFPHQEPVDIFCWSLSVSLEAGEEVVSRRKEKL